VQDDEGDDGELRRHPPEEPHDVDLVLHVEVVDRLVEKQDLRLLGERPGDEDLLHLPTGKLEDAPQGLCLQAQEGQDPQDHLPVAIRDAPLQVRRPAQQDGVEDRKGRLGGFLGQIAHEAGDLTRAHAIHGAPLDQDGPPLGDEESMDRPQKRRLARAVFAQDGDELAGLGPEAHLPEHGRPAVGKADSFDLERHGTLRPFIRR